jgi:hypothetical protein
MTHTTPQAAPGSTQRPAQTSGDPMNGCAEKTPQRPLQPHADPAAQNGPKRIQRKRSPGWRMPEGAVYVGRGTRYGNPWRIEREDDCPGYNVVNPDRRVHAGTFDTIEDAREVATQQFRHDVTGRPDLHEAIRNELGGQDLACWCPPPAEGEPDHCHAAVLLELANRETPDA